MPVDFDRDEFRKALREQFDYLLRNESKQLLQESLNELVRGRLEKLAEDELNILGSECDDGLPGAVEKLAGVHMHLSPLDIDHRTLVRHVLKKEMKKMLSEFVNASIE